MADSPPGSGIPILGPILSVLTDLFSNAQRVEDLSRAVGQVEQTAWTNLLSLATFSYGLFGGISGFLDGLKKWLHDNLWHWLKDIIWGHIKNLFDRIRKWITNLRNWIKLHVAALQQIQRNLDRARSVYFRKMIDIVQRIRKILLPFRLLHLGFAKKLDAYLVGLEGDIGAKWARLIQHQNLVLGVLNDIIDPRNIMRPGSMLGSVGAMVAAIHGAIGAADLRTLLCLTPSVAASPLIAPWSTTQAIVLNEIETRSGDYGAARAVRDTALRDYADDFGTTSLA